MAGSGNSIHWGTDSNTTYGMIQNMTKGVGGITRQYRDDSGEVKVIKTYDKHKTVQITALCPSTLPTLPEKGDTASLGGETIYVEDCSLNYANEDATSITISGRTYEGVTVA